MSRRPGLVETLPTLKQLGIKASGAGRNDQEARAPAMMDLPKARVLVLALGATSSGIFRRWAAKSDAPGVNLLPDVSEPSALAVPGHIATLRRPGDLVVVSIHWGSNWGYDVPHEQKIFARTLIDKAGVSSFTGIPRIIPELSKSIAIVSSHSLRLRRFPERL